MSVCAGYPVGTLPGRGVCMVSPPAGVAKIDPSLSSLVQGLVQSVSVGLHGSSPDPGLTLFMF